MSGSESEALSAIVVNRSITISSPRGVNNAVKPNEGSKICSSCKLDKAMSEFVGTSTRHKGQEMRTCGECRTKNLRVPARRLKGPVPIVNRVVPRNPDNESTRKGRVTRRQTTSSTTTTTSGAAASKLSTNTPTTTATTNKPPAATYTTPSKTQALQRSAPVAAPAMAPAVIELPAPEPEQDEDNTDTDEEYYQPPPAPAVKSLKRQSTPPHSVGEDMDQEEAIQVRPPLPKRHRVSASAAQREIELEPEVEADEEVEDGEPVLNANGHLVGSDLAAFAASLGRLSQLLVNAGKHLDHERIGALESEIHHDWRVDEMATFVEGFLKGASANTVGKGW